jgi:excisionase family DNA binding protein
MTSAARNLEQRMPDWKLAYRVDEAAVALGFGKSKVWELIKHKKIAVKRDHGCTIILRTELQRYLDALTS